MVKYWNSRHTGCWRAALQFRLVKPSVIYLPFCWYYSHKWIYEQIRIIIHYCSYGKRNMWLEKNNYLIHLISHQKSNIATCWNLPTIWPCCVQFWSATAHGINTTGATGRKMLWKSAVFLMIIPRSVQPIQCWILCGERWRKHLGHSAKTEKEQYQRMETTSSTECLWTRCGRNALMTIVATSAIFGDSFFSSCGNLMSRWECWWSWGPEPKVLRNLSDTWMFPKIRVPQIFGFSDQGWMMLFLLVISGESG